jgi:polysaccharide biosynthesis protein PslH
MTRPHIFMLTPYLPYPPVSGGRMRTYNLIKHLGDDHDITLVSYGRPEERAFDITPLGEYSDYHVVDRQSSPSTLQAAWLSLTSTQPIMSQLYGTPQMRTICADLLRQRPADIIHVESFYMLQNIPDDAGAPVLLSEPAIEYRAWGKFAALAQPWYTRPGVVLEALKLRFAEPAAWAAADAVGAMSDVDAAIIRKAAPSAHVVLAPNGVDVTFFHRDDSVPRDNCTVVYMGDYKYFPNTDAVAYFVQAIMPRIKAQRPDFHLTLLGKDPPPEIQALAGDDVTVTGLVEDTRPYLQSSAVFICPLRTGSGTRFKLMEALACGCPVVSTSIGCEGLDAVDGEHMLIRDEPGAFADAVVTLLDDPARGRAIGQAGRQWVEAKHAWAHSARLLREAYANLIRG